MVYNVIVLNVIYIGSIYIDMIIVISSRNIKNKIIYDTFVVIYYQSILRWLNVIINNKMKIYHSRICLGKIL